MTFNFEKALYFISKNSKTVFTLLGELTMAAETDAGYKVRGSYNNYEKTNKDRGLWHLHKQ